MPDYAEGNFPPWYPQRLFITTVMIEGGVTSIGDLAFAECSSLTSVNIPEGVTSIGKIGVFHQRYSSARTTEAFGQNQFSVR
ncbi:MAG: leucine-rich repeat domain-containing protein, partial [Dysgonamonadaceae bacterium]|jgi:hypothetical protein|nr:leucine-rich repeat domain-containing protein [Dysgonamonadaceae bacterium]